jgi:hypothetical protein
MRASLKSHMNQTGRIQSTGTTMNKRISVANLRMLRSLITSKLLVSGFSLVLVGQGLVSQSYSQEAPAAAFRTKSIDASVCNDAKTKEKNERLKPEAFDIAAIEAYYKDCLFARLSQPNADQMNKARAEIFADIELIERRAKQNPEMLVEYNKMILRQVKEILSKDAEGKGYHPTTRVLGVVVAGRVNRQPASNAGPGLGDPSATKLLLDLLDPKENESDGMVAAALSYLQRHWTSPGLDAAGLERAQAQFLSHIQAHMSKPKPTNRAKKEDEYIKELMIENLTAVATGKGDAAKQAAPMLIALTLPAMKEPKKTSEWLIEKALWSFGQVKHSDLKPEDIQTIQKGALEYTKASLDGWSARCDKTSAASGGGYMGMGGGGSMGGPGGGAGGLGLSGGPGLGSEDGGGGAGGPPGLGGGAGGPPGFGGTTSKKSNVFEDQPKEVRNARRLLQQRLERIHYGLTGTGRKGTSDPAEAKGLTSLSDEASKTKLLEVVAKVEALQDELNKDTLTSLDVVKSSTRRPIFDLKQAIASIIGDDGTNKPPTDEPAGKDPVDDGFGGGGNQ